MFYNKYNLKRCKNYNLRKDMIFVNKEFDIVEYNIDNIKNLIYTIRGKQVMLDSDVAKLYNCETKYVNRVVKRNIERFPEEFCFQLEQKEFQNLRCQFGTSSFEKQNYGGRRYMPFVFTEQGIAMLSALLKSDIAVNVSIQIMKAFLWTLSSRNMNGKKYNISKAEELEKQTKLINSFLKLAYWY